MTNNAEPRYVTNHELEAALGKLEVRLIKWFIGTGLGIAAVAATLAAVLARVLLPVATIATAAP